MRISLIFNISGLLLIQLPPNKICILIIIKYLIYVNKFLMFVDKSELNRSHLL